VNDKIDTAFDPNDYARNLTHRPGVYRMRDAQGKVLYVGKARDLKKRVSSYFGRSPDSAKTASMLAHVAGIDVTVTNTEAEALLLEYNLIKKHKPRFNVLLRDDKSYPYIYVATEHPFPRLEFHRGPRKGRGRYFGPYPSTVAVRKTLNELQKLFLVRQCNDTFFSNRTRPCLQYQIRRCTAPCVGLVDAAQYREDIDAAIQFLEGKNRSVINAFVKRMEEAAAHREYERAARYRDQIGRLKEIESQQLVSRHAPRDLDVVASASRPGMHCITVLFIRNGAILGSRNHFPKLAGEASKGAIMSGFLSQYYLGREAPPEIVVDAAVEDRDLLEAEFAKRARRTVSIRPNVRGRRARWLTLAATNAMQGLSMKVASNATLQRQFGALGQALNMEASPERLECFDISHTSGEATVASCVVFNQSGPLKSDYRRFNLKPTSAGDDYAAMKEALGRRYARVRKGEVPMPDVLFVDGGKGQLAQAMTVLDELEIDWLQVVAVAKGRARRPGTEQLFLAGQNTPLILPADSPALHLVQQIRDEAHRFAITGHRRQRGKARTTSRLEQIPGLGPKRRRELLRQFGGLHGVSAASMDDLAKVHGISKALAERIYDDLHLEGQN